VQRAFATDVDRDDVVSQWMPLWRTAIRRATEAASVHRDRIVSVDERDLLREPVRVVGALCERIGAAAPPERSVAALAAVLRERRRAPRSRPERDDRSRLEVLPALRDVQAELDSVLPPLWERRGDGEGRR
jgi:hypothetical protein